MALYEDADPAYGTNPTRRKGLGISINSPGKHWDSPCWRDIVVASTARTLLDRHIYQLIAERTKARWPIFAGEIEDSMAYGDRTAWLVRMLVRGGGTRHGVVRHRLGYLRWLGVIQYKGSYGTVAIEHLYPDHMRADVNRTLPLRGKRGVPYEVKSIEDALPRVETNNNAQPGGEAPLPSPG